MLIILNEILLIPLVSFIDSDNSLDNPLFFLYDDILLTDGALTAAFTVLAVLRWTGISCWIYDYFIETYSNSCSFLTLLIGYRVY